MAWRVPSQSRAPRSVLNGVAARHAEAASLFRNGDVDRSVEIFEEVLDFCTSSLGAEHSDTLTVAGNYAVVLFVAGYEDGSDLLAAHVTERERLLGAQHPRTLAAVEALATAHRLSGRFDDAAAISATVAAERRRVLGPAHCDTLTSRLSMAHSRAAEGDPESALSLLQSALRDAEHEHGRLHQHTITLRANTGGCLAALGRPQEAIPHLQRAVSDSEMALGSDHPITTELIEDLACVYEPEAFSMHVAV